MKAKHVTLGRPRPQHLRPLPVERGLADLPVLPLPEAELDRKAAGEEEPEVGREGAGVPDEGQAVGVPDE